MLPEKVGGVMKLPILLASAACLLLAAPASAKNEQVEFGPAPAWVQPSEPLAVPDNARGLLFFRYQDTQIHLDKTGQENYVAYRVRLLHQNALQLGNLQITWNPAAGAPVVHRLVVYRDGVERDVLAATKFSILQREDRLEEAALTGLLTAVLQVPDLRVGDEIEFAVTVPGNDPTFGADNSGILALGAEPSPGRFQMRVDWEDGQEPHLSVTHDLDAFTTRDAHALAIRADMPGTITPPKDAPPRYGFQRLVEFSDFADWKAISRRFAPLFAAASKPAKDSPIRQEAARIAAAHPDAKGRAAAALKLVQQQVRYIFVGLDGGNFTPATADQTWERRYGDCKGKTALLLALLGELGIEAEPVLANNSGLDDGLDAHLPNPGAFDHVLVRAKIDGKDYWLDGTMPPVVPASLDPVLPYRWVLPLDATGAGLEQVPWKPKTVPDEISLYEIDARKGLDEPATITDTTITRGPKALGQYLQYSAITESQLENAFRQQLEGSNAWNTVEKVSWRFDEPTQASVLEIKGTGPLSWDKEDDGGRSLALVGAGFNPPARRQRSSDQDQTAPFYRAPEFDCNVTTVRLPEATPETDWWYNTAFDTMMYGQTFRRSFERRDGAVRMIRSNRTLLLEIDPASAARDNGRLANFDNSMGWLRYEPGRDSTLVSRETVPATYDLDWVADSSACLTPKRK